MQSRANLVQSFSAGAALFTLLSGLLVLIGWAADIEPLRRVFISDVHMLPNTAVCFLLAGIALLIRQREQPGHVALRIAQLCAIVVIVVGGITGIERLTNWNAGIDMLLFPELVAQHRYRPLGRMAGNSTVAFMLAGMALLMVDVRTRRNIRPGAWMSVLGIVIASIAMVGYLYDAPRLYLGDRVAGMALSTALAFFALHAGILLSREGGAATLLLGRGGGGMMARRLLAVIVLAPLILGKLILLGRDEELLSRETAMAVFVVAAIGIIVIVALRSAVSVYEGERAREALLEREAAARREAERAIDSKNDFLAVMSHELRTPLHAIIGYSSLMNEGIPDTPSDGQRRQLDRITSSARHLLALIDEILALSRMELGQDQMTPSEVSVAQVVRDAATMIEPQAAAKGLIFTIDVHPDITTIQTDARKLRQALVNLLGNAVKFTDTGTIRLRVVVDADQNFIDFNVEDTGTGIAPEHLERVFDSFWQADQAPTRRAGGVGLGLHVTRQLARLLGGEVTVRSTLGEGSVFTVRLPKYWWGASTAEFPRITPSSIDAVRRGDRPVVIS